MKDQIFISYRRNGGEAMAQLLHDKLVERGFRVFYDIESLKSGPFDTKLYEKIEECEDFVLILPPQALDRCIYDEDWVRCEIRHALKHSKNIIPILMRGFVFPNDLPNDIYAVSKMNGVEFETMEYLNARVDKIVSMLLSKGNQDDPYREKDDKPSLIKNVCSFGSCDFNNTSPSDAYYSEILDRDRFNVVYFSISTATMRDKSKVSSEMVIYDENNNKVFEDTSEFDWQPNYNKIVRSWIIRGENGSFVKTGIYTVKFRIENSSVYEYKFKVTSKSDELLRGPNNEDSDPLNKESKVPKNKIEKNLSRPKGLLLHLGTSVPFVISLATFSGDVIGVGLIFLALAAIAGVYLIRYTKNYLIDNWILAALLVLIGFWYYGLYLLIASVICLFMKSKWKEQLQNHSKSI